MDIKIVIAMHKEYSIPNDEIYIPLLSGKACNLIHDSKYYKDIIGINISEKNSAYNDACHLYWAWKNIDTQYIGLVHYRKLLSIKKSKNINDALTKTEIENLTRKYDIILPKKSKYYIWIAS